MGKLLTVIALFGALMFPGLALAQLSADGSGLKVTAEAAYGAEAINDSNSSIGVFVGKYIIQPVIGLTGLMFLILTVYAGIMWMTSSGDSKRVEKAKSILVASVTGAVIIASAYVIVNTVIDALAGNEPAGISFVQTAHAVFLDSGLEDAGTTSLYNTTQSAGVTVGLIIKAVVGVLGVLFLALTLYAGILWMTASGDEKQVAKAKGILVSTVIGLIICLSAFSITSFIVGQVQSTQQNTVAI